MRFSECLDLVFVNLSSASLQDIATNTSFDFGCLELEYYIMITPNFYSD